jgi:hypothetical protein
MWRKIDESSDESDCIRKANDITLQLLARLCAGQVVFRMHWGNQHLTPSVRITLGVPAADVQQRCHDGLSSSLRPGWFIGRMRQAICLPPVGPELRGKPVQKRSEEH